MPCFVAHVSGNLILRGKIHLVFKGEYIWPQLEEVRENPVKEWGVP
jgi:hypothetical protein